MASDEDVSFESYYLSAPNSPQRLSVDSVVAFYSAPPSPSLRDDPNNSSPNSDIEFDFGTIVGNGFHSASNFGPQAHSTNQRHRACDSLPAMAFADELFCEGKVMPLRPPPGSPRSVPGSRSPAGGSSPRSPFCWRSLWNDGFDPFAAALESVKEEEAGAHKNRRHHHHRRARSLSPLRAGGGSTGRAEPELPGPQTPIWEPNRDTFGPEGPGPQARMKLPGPRGLRIMRFLMRSKSTSSEDEEEVNRSKKKKNSLIRRLTFHGTDDSSIAKSPRSSSGPTPSRAITKVTALQYRPRLFLCLGHGRRSFRYVK